jgi:hypothetical protein
MTNPAATSATNAAALIVVATPLVNASRAASVTRSRTSGDRLDRMRWASLESTSASRRVVICRSERPAARASSTAVFVANSLAEVANRATPRELPSIELILKTPEAIPAKGSGTPLAWPTAASVIGVDMSPRPIPNSSSVPTTRG